MGITILENSMNQVWFTIIEVVELMCNEKIVKKTPTERKSWDDHYMEMAEYVAEMCTCAAGRKVGAVFVRDKRVLTTGFNGVPVGFPHPDVCVRKEQGIPSGQGLDMCGCAHAEANGIANAARVGVSLMDSTLYSTTEPCALCMGALANVGVKEVIYRDEYHHKISSDIAVFAGIRVISYENLVSESKEKTFETVTIKTEPAYTFPMITKLNN